MFQINNNVICNLECAKQNIKITNKYIKDTRFLSLNFKYGLIDVTFDE